ncbi:MAG: endonuclease III [Verrucomicrobia bacterium]|nr:endonuclease III [Verrucomicrobiota bacterium]MBS0637302.1 endonuclease III [Verrucomicrobiota bacterium]
MKRVQLIQKILDEYFPDPAIPLHHKDPYTMLIAVLLSAQCTDARVNSVTPALFRLADTPEKMSRLSYQEIQEIIRPCGLSERKAKAIKGLSEILVKQYGGEVPQTIEELEELPGVGHKTASVVVAQCFGIDAFPVDTHIHRLAKRWGLSQAKNVAMTERDLKKAFPKKSWIKVHLQIIYYARSFCPALKHDIAQCPICSALSTIKTIKR